MDQDISELDNLSGIRDARCNGGLDLRQSVQRLADDD
jgi:hypothetical protein